MKPFDPAKSSSRSAQDLDAEPDVSALTEIWDRSLRAFAAKATGGLSPAALANAWSDWAVHLAASPGKQLRLAEKAARKALRLQRYAAACASGANPADCIEPLAQDRRFVADDWRAPPFNFIAQGFLLQQQWWWNATTGVRGVTRQHERVMEFAARQMLDMFSPSNFFWTNPEVLGRTRKNMGANLMVGWRNALEDLHRAAAGAPEPGSDAFVVGETIAVSPGKVVYRNRLIELIQYEPTRAKVRPEPVVITPAWIMKYYILDLSPENSLVRYLTGRGFTVFMISWRNPGVEDRELGMEDYLRLGPMAALDVALEITGAKRAHACGYCIGGTLLTIAAAAMARDGDERLASLTLLAAQTDFRDAGELTLFINESQVSFLEDLMWREGFLDARHMAGAFQILRSNDLIWSRIVRTYLMGERRPPNDLSTWNADATRMPARMHSEYLRKLFLDNDLVEGRYEVAGDAVALSDIQTPTFAVGTETDHVAPWRSVHKAHLFFDAEVTFALTTGGHNSGIISPPTRKGRRFRMMSTGAHAPYRDPADWFAHAEEREGSWWPAWAEWLAERSGPPTPPPPMGRGLTGEPSLRDAPGDYVMQR